MLKPLIKKSISLALAFAIVLSLSCCGGDEDIILPDIVFVMFDHYSEERKFMSGKFIGTKGYYINNNGEIKYFEFEDDNKYSYINKSKDITIEEWTESLNIEEMHKRISEISIDTEYDPIPKEDLINYYKSLLKINKNTKVEYDATLLTAVHNFNVIYGIRTTDTNENEYIVIHEFRERYYEYRGINRNIRDLRDKLKPILHCGHMGIN